MRRFVLAAPIFFVVAAAFAQSISLPFPGPGGAVPAPSYTGPGDVVTGAVAWWGFRGYNAAYSGKAINICNQANTSCEDESIVSGNLSLGTLGQTCNNSSNICTVKTMYDQSGATACASSTACDVTNATAAHRPTLLISALASQPCAAFNTSNSQMMGFGNTLTQAQPVTLTMVSDRTGNTSTATEIVHTAGSNNPFIGHGFANKASAGANSSFSATANDNSFNAIQGVINNTTSSLTVNGTTTTGTVGGTQGFSAPLQIGDTSNTNTFCEGGVWPSAFSSTQLSNMNSNMRNYWGF